MDGELNRLHEEIISLRSQMHTLSNQTDSLSHPDLVKISQILDQKLNQYYRMSRQSFNGMKASVDRLLINVLMSDITLPYFMFLPYSVLLAILTSSFMKDTYKIDTQVLDPYNHYFYLSRSNRGQIDFTNG